MKAPGKVQIIAILLGLIGAAFFVYLLRSEGVSAVMKSLAVVGWGLLAVVAFHLIPLFIDAIAWYVLFPPGQRPPLRQLFWMRWAGEAVSTILPAAQVGGDIVRARLATFIGVPAAVSAATVMADITVGVFTQALYTITGLFLLLGVTGKATPKGPVIWGTLVAIVACSGFFALQRYGIFRLMALLVSKMASSSDWHSLVQGGERLDDAVRALYTHPAGVIACTFWTSLSWVAGAGEVWLALYLMGRHPTFTTAIILESVGQGIRAAAFLVPGAIGLFEGGYVGVGGLLGIPAEAAMALALIRRVRELSFGVPGVIAWQAFEAHRIWRLRRSGPTLT